MSRYNQHERAILDKGFKTGGFPVGKRQLVEIFDLSVSDDFNSLREDMRAALMMIESETMTMEQISSAAHICAVVAYKLQEPQS
jgi:hypothetical protein